MTLSQLILALQTLDSNKYVMTSIASGIVLLIGIFGFHLDSQIVLTQLGSVLAGLLIIIPTVAKLLHDGLIIAAHIKSGQPLPASLTPPVSALP